MQALLNELRTRGCLLGEREARVKDPTEHRGVSLEVLHATATALSQEEGGYDVPTLQNAIRTACSPRWSLAELLSPRHVGPATTLVSHTWTSPGDHPLLDTLNRTIQHVLETPEEEHESARVWMDVFAVRGSPRCQNISFCTEM